MSSFTTKFRNKKTGVIHEVFCWDDYYGRHNYGYKVDNVDPVLTEEQFQEKYEEVNEESHA